MKVDKIMSRDVETVGRDESLAVAARKMWDRDCGFLPVVEPTAGRLVGVVTDRDVCMGALTQDRRLRDIPVASVMSRPVRVCGPDDDLVVAEDQMRTHRVRRIPVVGPDGAIVGVCSLNDLALHTGLGAEGRSDLRPREVAKVLAAICEHRPQAAAATG